MLFSHTCTAGDVEDEYAVTSLEIIKKTDAFLSYMDSQNLDSKLKNGGKVSKQIQELGNWYRTRRNSLNEFQKALVEVRLGYLALNSLDAEIRFSSVYLLNSGTYFINKYPLGNKFYSLGLDALLNYYIWHGPLSKFLEIAERAKDPKNIESYAAGYKSGERYPVCAAKLHILSYFNAAIGFDADKNKQYQSSREILESTKECADPETKDALLHEYAQKSYLVGNYDAAIKAYTELINQHPKIGVRKEIIYRQDLAFVLNSQGRRSEALSEIQKALDKAMAEDVAIEQDVAFNFSIILGKTQSESSEKILLDLISATNDNYYLYKYFEQLSIIFERQNHKDEAILYQKISIDHSLRVYNAMLEGLNKANVKFDEQVDSLFRDSFRRLESLLSDQGRLAEADEVMGMIKSSEASEFSRGAGSRLPELIGMNGLTKREQPWVSRYKDISKKLTQISEECRNLERKKSEQTLSSEEEAKRIQLNEDLKIARTAFRFFLGELHQEFSNKGVERKFEITESSENNLQQLQKALKGLGDHTVLLRFYVLDDHIDAILTTSNLQLIRKIRIDSKTLNSKIFEFRRLLKTPEQDPKPLAQDLYRILIEPLKSDLEQAKTEILMLALDRNLRYLPFAALHDGGGYLIERWSTPIYLDLAKDSLLKTSSDPLYIAGLGLTKSVGQYGKLPAVKEELQGIVNQRVNDRPIGKIYLDDDFNAAQLRNVSKGDFSVIHVSSHFIFSPGTEVNSFLLLGDGTRLTLGDIRTQDYRFNNVNLLTLSACGTALGGGRDETGQEIDGFADLVLRQGAKSVMASLWSVADSSTALFMKYFYNFKIQNGMNKAESIRGAQLKMLKSKDQMGSYSHPFFWAPFILMGNWH